MSYIQLLLLLLSGLVFLECTAGGSVGTPPMLRWETSLIGERRRNATAPQRTSKLKPWDCTSVLIFFFSTYIMYLAAVLF
ncbi:GL18099 [Drosophila persimilis]|uniref:GL18099 n=1 Tax=Drosophila persimilis TaxID=7234 RepID=B4HC25_DROPE|nr:GL19533 [Drosophila persimilis]EDW40056.1 GL18099 [Drosophila persimilis]